MEAGGNERFNAFLAQYGVLKETHIVAKYNSSAARIYRDRIQALSEGRSWRDPIVVKEPIGSSGKKSPLGGGGDGGINGSQVDNNGWDSWDSEDNLRSASDLRRNQSARDVRGSDGAAKPVKSRSAEDMYTRTQYEASAANRDSFFARKMAENGSRPEGLPPSRGGRYVGFGSSPSPSERNNSQGDMFTVMSQVRVSFANTH